MKRQPHAEFPQFRSKLAAMGARKRQSVARESLHTMESSLSQFVPAEEVQKLGSLPGTQVVTDILAGGSRFYRLKR